MLAGISDGIHSVALTAQRRRRGGDAGKGLERRPHEWLATLM